MNVNVGVQSILYNVKIMRIYTQYTGIHTNDTCRRDYFKIKL